MRRHFIVTQISRLPGLPAEEEDDEEMQGLICKLQVTPSLGSPAWTDAYATQAGTGGTLAFTDPRGATNVPARFYRINCSAP